MRHAFRMWSGPICLLQLVLKEQLSFNLLLAEPGRLPSNSVSHVVCANLAAASGHSPWLGGTSLSDSRWAFLCLGQLVWTIVAAHDTDSSSLWSTIQFDWKLGINQPELFLFPFLSSRPFPHYRKGRGWKGGSQCSSPRSCSYLETGLWRWRARLCSSPSVQFEY